MQNGMYYISEHYLTPVFVSKERIGISKDGYTSIFFRSSKSYKWIKTEHLYNTNYEAYNGKNAVFINDLENANN